MTTKWSISEFYEKAWTLTWNHKELWIIGLAFLAFSGGGSSNLNFNGSSDFSSDTDSSETNMESMLVSEEGEETEFEKRSNQVVENVMDLGSQVVPQISPAVYALAGLEFFIAIFVSVILGIIISAWARAAIILGISEATKSERVNLTAVSHEVVPRIKSLIWISIIPMFVLAVGFIVMTIGAFILMAIGNVLGFIALFAVVLLNVYLLIRTTFAVIWAERFCVLEKLSGKDSFMKAWKLVPSTFSKILRLGIANAVSIGLLNLLLLAPVLGVGFASIIPMVQSGEWHWTGFLPVIATYVVSAPIMTLCNAVLTVFKNGTWHYAFTQVTSKEENV